MEREFDETSAPRRRLTPSMHAYIYTSGLPSRPHLHNDPRPPPSPLLPAASPLASPVVILLLRQAGLLRLHRAAPRSCCHHLATLGSHADFLGRGKSICLARAALDAAAGPVRCC